MSDGDKGFSNVLRGASNLVGGIGQMTTSIAKEASNTSSENGASVCHVVNAEPYRKMIKVRGFNQGPAASGSGSMPPSGKFFEFQLSETRFPAFRGLDLPQLLQ